MLKFPRHLLIFLLVASVHAEQESGAVAGAKKAADSPERMDVARLQVVLDRAHFRPGKIDGLGGEFTNKAAERYQKATGTDPLTQIATIANPYREYTVADEDLKWIGPVASEPEEQAKLKAMLYGDAWELVAERFHCDIDFLHELNPQLKGGLQPGDRLVVPDVEEFRLADVLALKKERETPEDQADTESEKAEPAQPQTRLALLRDDRIIEVYKDEKLVASVPCTPGSSETPVPAGQWKIKTNVLMPDFRWDKSVLETGVPSKEFFMLKPGPNNPVGIVWMGINKPSVGMHGTDSPDQIGRNQSHGCIRTANWDAFLLTQLIKKGTPVEVK